MCMANPGNADKCVPMFMTGLGAEGNNDVGSLLLWLTLNARFIARRNFE